MSITRFMFRKEPDVITEQNIICEETFPVNVFETHFKKDMKIVFWKYKKLESAHPDMREQQFEIMVNQLSKIIIKIAEEVKAKEIRYKLTYTKITVPPSYSSKLDADLKIEFLSNEYNSTKHTDKIEVSITFPIKRAACYLKRGCVKIKVESSKEAFRFCLLTDFISKEEIIDQIVEKYFKRDTFKWKIKEKLRKILKI